MRSAIEDPEPIPVRPALADPMAALDADELRHLLLALGRAHPELIDEVEARVEGREPDPPPWADDMGWLLVGAQAIRVFMELVRCGQRGHPLH